MEVRRARFGPGPRRQARWVGRDSGAQRVGPGQCAAFRPGAVTHTLPATGAPSARRSAGQLAARLTNGALRRGVLRPGAGHRRGGAAARDRCAPAQEGAGQAAPPPAARVPDILRRSSRHSPARSRSPCTSRVSSASLGRPRSAWRAGGAPLMLASERSRSPRHTDFSRRS